MNKVSSLKPYDFMVKHTPQEAWIRGKGVFLWLAFFFSEIGAGIYFVSLFLNIRPGWLIGWLLTLLVGGSVHLLYLGKPSRVLLMFLQPARSELSRGLWVILFFAVLGFIQVAPIVVPWLPWTGNSVTLKVIIGIVCILLITHGFLTMSMVRAIPIWNSSMMVPFSVVSGIWVGSQCTVLLSYFFGQDVSLAEIWARWSFFGFIAFLGVFLLGTTQSSPTARISVKRILAGEWSNRFYIGVVAIGIAIPMIITLSVWGKNINSVNIWVLTLRCICIAIGDLMMRYGIMKNAYYSPLI